MKKEIDIAIEDELFKEKYFSVKEKYLLLKYEKRNRYSH